MTFVGRPRADYLDRNGTVKSLRLYSTDGSGLNPQSDNEHEHWLVSDVSEFRVVLIAYGLDANVSDFHDRIVSSDVNFEPLAWYSWATLNDQ